MKVANEIRKEVDAEYVYMLRWIRECWRKGRKVADQFDDIGLPEVPVEVTIGPKGPYSSWEMLLKTDDDNIRRQVQFAILEALDGDGNAVFKKKLGWGGSERTVKWELTRAVNGVGYLTITAGEKLQCKKIRVGTEPIYDWVCELK